MTQGTNRIFLRKTKHVVFILTPRNMENKWETCEDWELGTDTAGMEEHILAVPIFFPCMETF